MEVTLFGNHVYIGAKIYYIKCDSNKMFMFETMDIYCQEIGGDGFRHGFKISTI